MAAIELITGGVIINFCQIFIKKKKAQTYLSALSSFLFFALKFA